MSDRDPSRDATPATPDGAPSSDRPTDRDPVALAPTAAPPAALAMAPTAAARTDEPPAGVASTVASDAGPGRGDAGPITLSRLRPRGARYRRGAVIGAGGMGEVAVAVDDDVGREVAIKRLRAGDAAPEAIARFLREARIQARLEHPAIVPVHDLGLDDDGAPFFAMKRLAGTTLAALIADAPRPRLLRAFVDVCLAVEFAHTRGVVHRDLKPANVMLGDFGEVYVLDWGIARLVAESDDAAPRAAIDPAAIEGAPSDVATRAGAMMGTPGYMAPEQARGEPVDARADVYALGCVLFEILARAPLHPRAGAIASTLAGADARPRVRGAECPPELEAACVRATALAPADRFASARALGDAVQRYLDGDRDEQRRRALAEAHTAAARVAVGADDRATAMREAGRALALDPTSEAAARLVGQLMLTPPRELPPDVRTRLHAADLAASREQSGLGVAAFGAYFVFVPLLLWRGVIDWAWFAAAYGLVAAGVGHAWLMGRRAPTVARIATAVALNAAVVIAFSRVLGPYLITLELGVAVIASLATYPLLVERFALVYALLATVAWLPPLLERVGLFARTTTWTAGEVVVRPTAIAIGPSSELEMIGFGLLLLLFTGLFARRLARSQRRAAAQLELQAWHLRQLVPAS